MYICTGECSVCVYGCVCTWMGVHKGKGVSYFTFYCCGIMSKSVGGKDLSLTWQDPGSGS